MKKAEIIDRVAIANCDSGDSFVWRDIRELRLAKASHGGFNILKAQIFSKCLTEGTANLPDNPCPQLFTELHKASIIHHQMVVEELSRREFTGSVIIEEHRNAVRRIREIATELGVRYEEPEDPLLA